MRIALIADTFPPLRTSGAIQLRDLAREFVRQGHEVTVMLPAPGQSAPWKIEDFDGACLVRLRAPHTRDLGYVWRTLGELFMPFSMRRNLARSPMARTRWDGVIWYAPSIFHGPLARSLKRASGCKGYLIIRDIFPEWALDMGLMGRGPAYRFFRAVARYQYSVADVIGIQTEGNRGYFQCWQTGLGRKLEVLPNWLDKPLYTASALNIEATPLAGRKIFVYAGNMGVAQGLDIFLDLAQRFEGRTDIGFLWVGRGSEAARLRNIAKARGLTNTHFADEIDPDQISDLYAQCRAGIVALDPRHKSHNIPGKFLSYLQNGLPVLANVNAGNDIAGLIRDNSVGQVCETGQLKDLEAATEVLLAQINCDARLSARCRELFERDFAVDKAVRQIVAALSE
jgi:glycosyltransferase involved in cell wall biosynthesis